MPSVLRRTTIEQYFLRQHRTGISQIVLTVSANENGLSPTLILLTNSKMTLTLSLISRVRQRENRIRQQYHIKRAWLLR